MNIVSNIKSLFSQGTGTRKYITNTSWLLGARAVQMLVAFFVGAFVARYLGPGQYGIYNYVISYVGLFSALSTLGVGTIMVKDMLTERNPENIILGTGLGLRLMGSIVGSALILLVSYITGEDRNMRLFLFLASIQPLARSFEVLATYFQAKVQSKYSVIAQLISLCIISLLKIYFILHNYDLIWFIYLLAFDALIVSLIMILEYARLKQNIFRWQMHWRAAKNLLKESWPLVFSGMLTTVYLKIDQVMIGKMMDTTAVGLYAAAVKISEAWITIPWIISGSLYPALVNAYAKDRELFHLRIRQLYIILMGIALSVMIPIILFSDWIIHIIFQEAYADSATALRFHICSSLFIFLGSLNNRWLILENLQKYWMINSALGAIVNIILNLFLIPVMGINGAALATLLSYALAYHFAYAFTPKTRMIFHEQNKSLLRIILILPALRLLKINTASTQNLINK